MRLILALRISFNENRTWNLAEGDVVSMQAELQIALKLYMLTNSEGPQQTRKLTGKKVTIILADVCFLQTGR